MSRFNTGNPIGSNDPRDRDDNSKNFDLAVNDRDNDTFTDRLGNERRTWAGIEKAAQELLEEFLIAGGQIFPDEPTGRAAVSDGTYFLTEGDSEDVATILWQRIDAGESRRVADNPSAEMLREAVAESRAALYMASQPCNVDGEFHNNDFPYPKYSISGDGGQVMSAWDEDGFLINNARGEFHSGDHQPAIAFLGDGGQVMSAWDEDAQPITPWIHEFHSDEEVPDYCYVDVNQIVFQGWMRDGSQTIGGGGGLDVSGIPLTEQSIPENEAWNNLGAVSVKREYLPIYKESATTKFPTTASVYAYMGDLVSEFDDYLSSEIIGEDPLGGAIMAYRAKPSDYVEIDQGLSYPQSSVERPKIILISAVHGDEQHPVPSNIALFEEICRQWREIDRVDQLRWGVDLIFVPVANPSGFDARTRRNANNVDLNRNFPTRWASGDFSGDFAASEPETRALVQLLNDHDDAVALIDHHRMFRFQGNGERIVWIASEGQGNIGVAINALNSSISEVKRRYPFVPQNNDPVGSISSHFDGSLALHANNQFDIPGFLLETPSALGGTTEQLYVHARRCVVNLIWEVFQKELSSRRNSFSI